MIVVSFSCVKGNDSAYILAVEVVLQSGAMGTVFQWRESNDPQSLLGSFPW